MFKVVTFVTFLCFHVVSAQAISFGFCFEKSISLELVKNHLSIIQTSRDQIFFKKRAHCLEVKTSSIRQELFGKWIRSKFKVLSSYEEGSGSFAIKREGELNNCHIEVSIKEFHHLDEDAFFIKKKGAARETIKNALNSVQSKIIISQGRRAQLKVNAHHLELECREKGTSKYLINFFLKTKSGELTRSAFIIKGEEFNVSEVIEKLESKPTKVSPHGVTIEKRRKQAQRQYFLKVVN